MIRSTDVDEVVASLERSRLEGIVRLDIGVIARARSVLARVGSAAAGRVGFVVDVTASTVTIFVIADGRLVDVRSAAAVDPASQVRDMVTTLGALEEVQARVPAALRRSSEHRPWFSIHVPAPAVESVRAACGSVLPRAMTADVLRPVPWVRSAP
jgi:hypothetical protein